MNWCPHGIWDQKAAQVPACLQIDVSLNFFFNRTAKWRFAKRGVFVELSLKRRARTAKKKSDARLVEFSLSSYAQFLGSRM